MTNYSHERRDPCLSASQLDALGKSPLQRNQIGNSEPYEYRCSGKDLCSLLLEIADRETDLDRLRALHDAADMASRNIPVPTKWTGDAVAMQVLRVWYDEDGIHVEQIPESALREASSLAPPQHSSPEAKS